MEGTPKTKEEWAQYMARPMTERGYLTDEEMTHVSQVEVPSLRVLQAEGAIRAVKAPSVRGGFYRVWPIFDAVKATLAGAINKYLDFTMRAAAGVLVLISDEIWDVMIWTVKNEISTDDVKGRMLFDRDVAWLLPWESDWYISIIDRLYVHLGCDEKTMKEVFWTNDDNLVLGVYDFGKSANEFVPIKVKREIIESSEAEMEESAKIDDEGEKKAFHFAVALARRAGISYHSHWVKTSLNLSVQYRAAERRYHGLEVVTPQRGTDERQSMRARRGSGNRPAPS
ncbi:MAG TPA: hypothetical protein VGE72_29050 [Azospirillum sp.]